MPRRVRRIEVWLGKRRNVVESARDWEINAGPGTSDVQFVVLKRQ